MLHSTSSTVIPKIINVVQRPIASGGNAISLSDTGRRTLWLSGTSWLEAELAVSGVETKTCTDAWARPTSVTTTTTLAHACSAEDSLLWNRHRTRDTPSHPRKVTNMRHDMLGKCPKYTLPVYRSAGACGAPGWPSHPGTMGGHLWPWTNSRKASAARK